MSSPLPASDPTRHRGTVLSIAAGQAVIGVAVQGCSSCGQKKSCGVGKLSGGGKTARVTLPARAGLAVGDVVSLSVPQSALNRAALLGYLLPATLLAVGSVLGHNALGSDLGAALGAAAGIAAGLLLVRFLPRLLPRFFAGATVPLTLE